MSKQMRTLRYEVILRAEEPIAHAERTVNNHSIAAKETMVAEDGQILRVPVLKANAIRHGLREAGVFAALDCAGINPHDLLEHDYLLQLLFSGGTNLESKAGKAGKSIRGARIDDWQRLVDLLPPIELFGCSLSANMERGIVAVCNARLLCDELPHPTTWCTEWMRESGRQFHNSRAYLSTVQEVGMDPTRDPSKRLMLTQSARADVGARLLASESASIAGDEVEAQKAKSSMMPYTYQTIARGSVFHWQCELEADTDLQEDTMLSVLGAFLSNARVGGKRSKGMGRIVPIAASSFTVARPSDQASALDSKSLGGRAGSLFKAHMSERGERLRELLTEIGCPPPKKAKKTA
jgi:hypothetical protein